MTGSSLVPHPSLPAKPVSLRDSTQPHPSNTTTSTTSFPLPSSSSSTLPPPTLASSSRSSTCALCSNVAKYTCPRCSLRTCSLACSTAHKSQSGCSGQRDPARYVPLRDYDQARWDGDYVWLEEGRRKVAEWGEGIDTAELGPEGGVGRGGRGGRGGSRGRGAGRGRGGAVTKGGRGNKADALAWRLRGVGVHVDFLPEGMQRRKQNQSSWHAKSKTIYLTIQALLPPLPDSSTPREIIFPRHPLSSPLSTSLDGHTSALSPFVVVLPYHPRPIRRPRVPFRPTTEASVEVSAVSAEGSGSTLNPESNPVPEVQRRQGVSYFFPPLDPSTPFVEALGGTAFIEFPTLHIIPQLEWDERVRKGEVEVVPLVPPEDLGRWGGKRARGDGQGGGDGDGDRDGESTSAGNEGKKGKVENDEEEARGLAGLGDYASDEEVDGGEDDDDDGGLEDHDVIIDDTDDHGEDDNETDENEDMDVTHLVPPEMAEAVVQALVADFPIPDTEQA